MLTGENNPTLARDTVFSVLMIVLNGMLGVTLLIGALRHHEQEYYLQGASAYLGVIIPLAVLGLISPRYTTSAPGGELSRQMAAFLVIMSVALYGIFLLIQTTCHSHFFRQPSASDDHNALHPDVAVKSIGYHAVFLVLSMVPIVLLSKNLAKLLDYGISTVGAPVALGGFLVAILVLSLKRWVRPAQPETTADVAAGDRVHRKSPD